MWCPKLHIIIVLSILKTLRSGDKDLAAKLNNADLWHCKLLMGSVDIFPVHLGIPHVQNKPWFSKRMTKVIRWVVKQKNAMWIMARWRHKPHLNEIRVPLVHILIVPSCMRKKSIHQMWDFILGWCWWRWWWLGWWW